MGYEWNLSILMQLNRRVDGIHSLDRHNEESARALIPRSWNTGPRLSRVGKAYKTKSRLLSPTAKQFLPSERTWSGYQIQLLNVEIREY